MIEERSKFVMESEKKQAKIEDGSSDDGWNDSSSETDSMLDLESGESSPVPAPLRQIPGEPGRLSAHLLSVASSIVGNMNQAYQAKCKEQASGYSQIDISSPPPPPPPPPVNPDSGAAPNPFFAASTPFGQWGCAQGSACGVDASATCDQASSTSGVGASSSPQTSSSSCGADPSGQSGSSLNDLFRSLLSGQRQESNIDIGEVLKIVLPVVQSFISSSTESSRERREKKEDDQTLAMMMSCLADCVSSTSGIADSTTQAYVFVDKLFCCYKLMSALVCSKNKDNALFNFAFKSLDKSICDQFKNALTQLSTS